MQCLRPLLLAAGCVVALACRDAARADDAARTRKDYSNSPIVVRMMAFDKNKDGKLTKDEVTDWRLHRLFDRADANHDGVVTKEELLAQAAREDDDDQPPGRGGRGPGGPGGPGGRGPGGRGGFGAPPQPGQILPPFVRQRLRLTREQQKQVDQLQKEVDEKLAKILTDEQKKQLKQMQRGFGRGGRGGFGGGPPPGGPGRGGPPRGGPGDRPEPPDGDR
jgi:hypothetical protein